MKWYEYEKKDIPKASLFFIKTIKDELAKKCWTYDSHVGEYAYIATTKFSYSYDVIKLIEKRLSKGQWVCKMIYYCRGDKGFFNYTFQMRKR